MSASRVERRFYAVRCDEYTTRPVRDRERAERLRADIDRERNCRLPHTVIEIEAERTR